MFGLQDIEIDKNLNLKINLKIIRSTISDEEKRVYVDERALVNGG